MGQAVDLAAAIAAGEQTSEHAVSAALDAAERLQPTLNAFTVLLRDEAIAAARRADEAARAGQQLGPLHGVPVAVKDLYDLAGTVTSGCSRAYLSTPPATSDAPAVAMLRRAGAIVIGKTNMHELAFGATTVVSCFGPANNPWDPERIPGGSSGGSGIAVAARVVGIALGSDTGGSIRVPAALCGVSGLKVTTGLLPLDGVLPMSPGLDTPGPIASDAADLAVAFSILSGDETPPRLDPIRPGLRVGVAVDPFFETVDPEISSAVRVAVDVLASAGADVRDVPTPWAQKADEAWLTIALGEFARAHAPLMDREQDLDPSIYSILFVAHRVSAEDERKARDEATAARNAFASTMADLDVLITPATPYPAPRHTDQTVVAGGVELPVHLGGPSHFTRLVSTIGAPAASIPCGATASGLPVAVQIVGRAGSERLLLAVAAAFQAETGWHRRVPPHHA